MGEGADEQQAVGVVAVAAAVATMTVDERRKGRHGACDGRWAPVVAAKREVELEVPAVKVQAKHWQMWQAISTSTIA